MNGFRGLPTIKLNCKLEKLSLITELIKRYEAEENDFAMNWKDICLLWAGRFTLTVLQLLLSELQQVNEAKFALQQYARNGLMATREHAPVFHHTG